MVHTDHAGGVRGKPSATVAEIGRSVGATAIAIRDFYTAAVGVEVEWARDVASRL